jgi:hypothetical protein
MMIPLAVPQKFKSRDRIGKDLMFVDLAAQEPP